MATMRRKRRSHSVSNRNTLPDHHISPPDDDLFLNKRDNPLFCSEDTGRSVRRNPGLATPRVGRSVSRTHCQASHSEAEQDYVIPSSYSNQNVNLPANRTTKGGVNDNVADVHRETVKQSTELSVNSDSYSEGPWEDAVSTGFLTEAEENTIKAFYEQIKGDNVDGAVSPSNKIYETVRSEVKRAILDIQNDLENSIQRNNTHTMASTNVTDIPPDLVNPGAVELVSDIRKQYAKKLEESQERATKLRADLAVEEHRGPDGEAALLAHDDGSCTYYDIANSEVKSEYKPPVGISQNMWRDCWIVRAPGPDGSSGRYVVAASAGNTLESGFCSWDFYNKDIRAFHIEDGNTNNTRTALAPLPNNPSYRRNSFSNIIASENRHGWYKPCGPLIVSTSSNQKGVCIYDIRDGEQIMGWEVQKPVLSMDYSSPLQWRNRGKVVIAESECVSLWDVSSLTPQALQSISTSGRRVCALHVNNTDAELGGGVRQRVSSSEAEGHDGVFCTADTINVVDFRHPSGIGLKISKIGVNVQSLFSRGDSIYLGCNNAKSGKNSPCPQIQQFSLRKQKLVSTYSFPESNAHPHYTAITQVWGNSNLVIGVCGLGLFVFDALKDDGVRFPTEYCSMQKVRETIGPNDLYSPSFDYLSSRVLLISRDRPAMWRYLS